MPLNKSGILGGSVLLCLLALLVLACMQLENGKQVCGRGENKNKKQTTEMLEVNVLQGEAESDLTSDVLISMSCMFSLVKKIS